MFEQDCYIQEFSNEQKHTELHGKSAFAAGDFYSTVILPAVHSADERVYKRCLES